MCIRDSLYLRKLATSWTAKCFTRLVGLLKGNFLFSPVPHVTLGHRIFAACCPIPVCFGVTDQRKFIWRSITRILAHCGLMNGFEITKHPCTRNTRKMSFYQTGIDPVSYTHLDVYKRQVNGWRHIPRQLLNYKLEDEEVWGIWRSHFLFNP